MEDLSEIVNFISLQEKKSKEKNILKDKKGKDEKADNGEDEELSVAAGVNLLSPVNVEREPTPEIQTGPLTDLAKRKFTQQQASQGIGSEQRGTAGVVGFVGSSPTIAASKTGFVTPGKSVADVVAAGRLQRIAASYDPFQNNKDTLTENAKLIKKRVLSLLNKEPHKTTINKMRQELHGE